MDEDRDDSESAHEATSSGSTGDTLPCGSAASSGSTKSIGDNNERTAIAACGGNMDGPLHRDAAGNARVVQVGKGIGWDGGGSSWGGDICMGCCSEFEEGGGGSKSGLRRFLRFFGAFESYSWNVS